MTVSASEIAEWFSRAKSGDTEWLRDARKLLAIPGPDQDTAIPLLISKLSGDPHWAAAALLAAIGPNAISAGPTLLSCSTSPDWEMRLEVANAVSCMAYHDSAAIQTLQVLLEDEILFVQVAAAAALLELSGSSDKIVRILDAGIQDSDFRVYLWAAYALAEAFPTCPQVRPSVYKMLAHNDDQITEIAARAFAKSPPAQTIPYLLQEMHYAADWHKRGILLAIRECSEAAEPYLDAISKTLLAENLFHSTLGDVRRRATNVAAAIQARSPDILIAIQTLLDDPEGWTREQAANALLQLDSATPAQKLAAAKRHRDDDNHPIISKDIASAVRKILQENGETNIPPDTFSSSTKTRK